MSETVDPAALETIWADLRDLLEWQQGFGLYLVFAADARVADVLLTSLTEWCQEHKLPIQAVRPLKSGDALEQVLAGLALDPALPNRPLWLDLGDWSSDPQWPKVRRTILAALNQRRSWLEQECRRPVFLHLPDSFAPEVVTWAPDLWSITRYIARLPSAATAQPRQPAVGAELAAEDALIGQIRVDVAQLAAQYQLLLPPEGNLQAVRDCALAIGKIGRKCMADGDNANALTCFQDSLALFRFLRQSAEDAPQSLYDLADALVLLAQLQQVLADFVPARDNLHRALGLRQRLLPTGGERVALITPIVVIEKMLAELEKAAGNNRTALAWLESALPQQREIAQSQDDSSAALQALLDTLRSLAEVQVGAGQIVLAAEHLQEASQLEALLDAEKEVQTYEDLAKNNSPLSRAGLALRLQTFAWQLAKYGKREQALPIAKRAVQIVEMLVTQDFVLYGPVLAMSLNNWSVWLAEAGQRTEALAASERAVQIYDDLARQNVAVNIPDLANSLNNWSLDLAEAGQRAAALAASERAVQIYENLARQNLATYGPDFAMNLNNWANRLADQGQRTEAQVASERAMQLYEGLARQNFTAYGPDLAGSLGNWAIRLAEAGQRSAALAASQRVVQIYDDLARQNFAAYGPDLAVSLNNWSVDLTEAGQRSEALAAIERAVQIREDLARQNFAAYGPDLAVSLNNWSLHLAAAGQRSKALAASDRTVQIREDLARQNFAAYGPDLAVSLNNWSLHLAEASQRTEALAAIGRAVQIHEDLARHNFAAYGPDLAMSLNNWSIHLAAVGQRTEARAAIERAVQIYEDLARQNPPKYEPELANSLANLANLTPRIAAVAHLNRARTLIRPYAHPGTTYEQWQKRIEQALQNNESGGIENQ